MRFSLQDVKKQVQRRGDDLYVALHFLRQGELQNEIERLIAYHESLLGQPQKQFSRDDTRAFVGDYRLANCLIAALSAWYSWQSPDWLTDLQRAVGAETEERRAEVEERRVEAEERRVETEERRAEASSAPTNPVISSNLFTSTTGNMEASGITSPVALRLALYSYVNERYSGFLSAEQRSVALQGFAGAYHLSVPDLEYLLALDSDDEALLVRATPELPTAQEVATLYNQWAFEAALFNASSVHFTIDCNAFMNAGTQLSNVGMQSSNNVGAQLIAPEAGLGAIIKRFCFLARRIGVYYDLAYESTLSPLAPLLHLTLYGPQDVTGLPQQYGLRLARLCRMLLGYGAAPRTAQGDTRRAGRKSTALVGALLEAEAVVHVLQRSYRFVLDANLLNLLPSPPASSTVNGQGQGSNERESSNLFDSSIEQLFAEAFASLERSQSVDGWRLEREPEPLLLEADAASGNMKGIFIPDFALTRNSRRMYMEILGFWTPAYRERKIQKLLHLQERNDVLLAIPVEARDAFTSIATSFPIVWYDGQLSVTELLNLLRNYCDDFAERVAQIDQVDVREHVQRAGLVSERACYDLLHCYRRSEVQQASERVVGEDIAFVPGIGLFSNAWMEHLRSSFVEWVGRAGTLPLADVLHESRERWPQLVGCEDATIEAILGLWPEVHVNRTSIFAATVSVGDTTEMAEDHTANVGAQFIAPEIAPAPAKKQVRERKATYKKRPVDETIQGDLWG